MQFRHLATSLALALALAACGDDDDDGTGDVGDGDVVVTGAIESRWDGSSVYGAVEGEGFAIVVFDSELVDINDPEAYDGELVGFAFVDGGNPGTGTFDLSSNGNVQAVYFDSDAGIVCFATEGTLRITSSVAGDFDFDASCFDESANELLINVEGSFDAEDINDFNG